MKSVYATTLILLAACGLQAAKDDEKLAPIPKDGEGRYGVYTFADAKAQAAKKKRPLAMIVQNDRSEEAAEKNAILKAFWGMEKDAVMVMVTSRLMVDAKARFTPESLEALNSAEAGKTLPRLVVMNSDATIPLGVMNAEQIMAADEKAFKEFSKKMEDSNKNPSGSKITLTPAGAKPAAPAAPATPAAATPGAPAPATAPAGPVAIKDAKPESWTNAEGKAIQMTLVEVNGPQATFQLADGRKVPLDIAKLSDASKKRVEELAAASK